MTDFAARLDFAAIRARRTSIRRGVLILARRARTHRLAVCAAPLAGDTSLDAMPRALRYPWTGGYVSMARAAGLERIAEGVPRANDCVDEVLDFDLFPSRPASATPARVTSTDRRKAGPKGVCRDDVAIADRDNARACKGRAA